MRAIGKCVLFTDSVEDDRLAMLDAGLTAGKQVVRFILCLLVYLINLDDIFCSSLKSVDNPSESIDTKQVVRTMYIYLWPFLQ